MNFEFAYSEKELENLTSAERFTPYNMLGEESFVYQKLSENDKKTLEHLVKAADVIDTVYKKLDNPYNLEFEEYLNSEISRGNKSAELTKRLYDGQLGIFANNVAGTPVSLVSNIENKPNKGLYPEDLTIEEFHNILIKMLNEGEDEEVKQILNARTVVVRDGENLKAIDYTEQFKDEFLVVADELEKAATYSEDKNFKEFLILQSKALRENNPLLDCEADKKWATLQDTTLEFTISRECYDDKFTPSVASNKKLQEMLAEREIIPYAKDNLGARVGIIDKKGTDYLLRIEKMLPLMAEKMPYSDQYTQTVSQGKAQTMVDADIVYATGDMGSYRGAISLASNLPNNDKLSVLTGGGHRTVYHKQMREAKYSDGIQEKLEVLLNDDFHKYFSTNALHNFTILHENVHSLGPKDGNEGLGVYKNIIEEHKADAGAVVMLDELKKEGFYSEHEQKEILTSWVVAYIYPGANFSNAHATRNIMQHNYLIQNDAIKFDELGRMKLDFEKITECAKEMLNKSIKLQLRGDASEAKAYIDKYAIYTNEIRGLAEKLSAVSKRLNSYTVQPLAKKILKK